MDKTPEQLATENTLIMNIGTTEDPDVIVTCDEVIRDEGDRIEIIVARLKDAEDYSVVVNYQHRSMEDPDSNLWEWLNTFLEVGRIRGYNVPDQAVHLFTTNLRALAESNAMGLSQHAIGYQIRLTLGFSHEPHEVPDDGPVLKVFLEYEELFLLHQTLTRDDHPDVENDGERHPTTQVSEVLFSAALYGLTEEYTRDYEGDASGEDAGIGEENA